MARIVENNIMEDVWTLIKASFVVSSLYLLDKIYLFSINLIGIRFPEVEIYLKDIGFIVKFITVLMVAAITAFKLRKEIKNRNEKQG